MSNDKKPENSGARSVLATFRSGRLPFADVGGCANVILASPSSGNITPATIPSQPADFTVVNSELGRREQPNAPRSLGVVQKFAALFDKLAK